MIHNPTCSKCSAAEYTLVGARHGDDYYECPNCGHTEPAFVTYGSDEPDAPKAAREHWLGLPVGITVRADGSLGISVDFGDATVLDNYDDEIAPEWLAAVAAALDEGNYSFED